MNLSIRKFLLLNLLLTMFVSSAISIIGNFYLDRQDIQHHLDKNLSQSALTYQAFITDDLSREKLSATQKKITNVSEQLAKINYSKKSFLRKILENFQFQVWDKKGKLILRSKNSPKESLFNAPSGYSNRIINNKTWRIFANYNPTTGMRVVMSEPFINRALLGHELAQDQIYIMLLVFPILGLLIWIIIGRGLNSLTRVADEVAYRDPTYLEAVKLEHVPIEIKPLIHELNKLLARLKSAIEREKRFSGDAAHELRTPLAGLKAQTQVALQTTDEIERRLALQKVLKGVDRSSHVVQQLLTLSRLVPDSGVSQDNIPVEVGKIAAEIIADLAALALNKHIEIELLGTSEPNIILGNPIAIGILIRNLVDNAIRYTPNHGHVTVSLTQSKQHIILRVADSGPGIPAKQHERVFERFYRGLGTKQHGSGLGLAIVAQIAELHHAPIDLGIPKGNKGLLISVKFNKMQ